MNLHVAQSLLARAEVMTIMSNTHAIVSAQNNAPVMGPVQNALIGLYLLTNVWSAVGDATKSPCHDDSNIRIERQLLYERVCNLTRLSDKEKKKLWLQAERLGIYTTASSIEELKKDLAPPKFVDTMIKATTFHDMVMTADISSKRYDNFIERAKRYYPEYFTSEGKLRSRIPGKLAVSVLFPHDFSFRKTTDTNDLEDIDVPTTSPERKPYSTVVIENGIILKQSGPICKKAVGIGRNTIVHFLYYTYSPATAGRFISEAQKITDRFIPAYGFSMGVSDCLTTKYDLIAQALADVNVKCSEISASNKDAEDKEREINQELNGVMGIAPKLAKTSMNKFDRNALVIMKKCGAKGSDVNNGQISGFVGQQNVNGKRIPLMLSDQSRSLPHFLPGDNSPEARGFVFNNYLHGLKFYEVFFHAAGGRQGVVDTAVKTADTGYVQKKMVVKLQDFKTFVDGTVRDANGNIVQFMYGGDGLDPKRMIYTKGVDFPFAVNTAIEASRLNCKAETEGVESTKRGLTKEETNLLVSYIQSGCPGVQTEVTERATYNLRVALRVALADVSIYPSEIPQFCKIVRDKIEIAKIAPGTLVGIGCASAIGEPSTQLTLNTFHNSGNSAKDVTLGVPRLKEILNTTKKPSKPSCTVYFTDSVNPTTFETIQTIGHSIEEVTVSMFLKEDETELRYLTVNDVAPSQSPLGLITYKEYEPVWWVKLHETLKGMPEVTPENWVIILHFDIDKLYKYKVTLDDIARRIEKDSPGTFGCVPSPTVLGCIEVYLNYTSIKAYVQSKIDLPESISDEEESELAELITTDSIDFFTAREVAMDTIRNTRIQGVCGITKTYPKEDLQTKKWFLETQGTNLMDILTTPGVDTTRTLSDNMWEIYSILGIEAARAFLIRETTKIISFDGTYVNPRHFALLVESMTRTGILTSVNRDGIPRDVGPLAKGMFEKAVDNFAEAAAFTENDLIKGVAGAVMMGTTADKAGTGGVEVKDAEKLPSRVAHSSKSVEVKIAKKSAIQKKGKILDAVNITHKK